MEKYQLQPPQVSTAEFLATVPLFAGLEDAERAEVAARMKTQTYREGEFVITQGDTGDSMYVLLEGAASVTIRLAGHMVPTFQPAASLAFFTRFLAAEPM